VVEAQQSRPAATGTRSRADRVTWWVGWALFAGILLFITGLLSMIQGLVALLDDEYYLVAPSGLVVEANYTTWGWVLLGLGALLALTGYGVTTGRTWARVVAIVLAVVNALVNLSFVAAYPIWSILAITLDVIVIYALSVHGGEARVFRS
jgi:hypothetical protein